MKPELKVVLSDLLFLLDGFRNQGIKYNENAFDAFLRMRELGCTAYSCLDSIIDTYGEEETEMNTDETEKRIEKLETLVTALCVGKQGWDDETRQIIGNANSIVHYHASKFIKNRVVEQEYSELKSKLTILEEDYPELKK